ncbi:hypothetical protein PNEG_04260 [Pneumocystis murina B123]|uniref:Uncharacterized protein n=1 Tax=Pneumocystis murina (strain B123) TaxID=1069680 RepID=A0A0W4ZX41_PNEMU|nr:hypothetical protein PNEG_04260 [Pneumocystis murina B123]KTW32938.1 hypothetical protein PNEG_04260 [Pneumocystis murina B123]
MDNENMEIIEYIFLNTFLISKCIFWIKRIIIILYTRFNFKKLISIRNKIIRKIFIFVTFQIKIVKSSVN